MKKQVSVAILLTCIFLVSCGRAPSPASSSQGASDTKAATSSEAQADESAAKEATKESGKRTRSSADSFPDILEDGKVLYFAVDSLEEDGEWGYTMHVSMQNRSDKDLMISLGNVSINGVMADPGWSDTVLKGMKAAGEIVWADGALSEKEIDDVSTIQFELIAFDDNDPGEGYLVDSSHTVYPKGKKNAKETSYTKAETDQALFDDGSCSMIITGKDPDGEWGYTLDACLINKTDRDLMFVAGDASVNDTMCDPCWSESVAAGKMSRCQIIWPKEELERAGIDSVDVIQLPVAVYDDKDYEQVRAEESFTVKN